MLRKWLAALRRLPPAPFVETESRRYSEAELAHVREVWLRYFNGTSVEAAVPGRKAPLRSVFKQRLAIQGRQRAAARWFLFSLSLAGGHAYRSDAMPAQPRPRNRRALRVRSAAPLLQGSHALVGAVR